MFLYFNLILSFHSLGKPFRVFLGFGLPGISIIEVVIAVDLSAANGKGERPNHIYLLLFVMYHGSIAMSFATSAITTLRPTYIWPRKLKTKPLVKLRLISSLSSRFRLWT